MWNYLQPGFWRYLQNPVIPTIYIFFTSSSFQGRKRVLQNFPFFSPPGSFLNNHISIKDVHLCWKTLDNLLQTMVNVECNNGIIIREKNKSLIIFLCLWISDGYLDPVEDRLSKQINVNLLGSHYHFLSSNCSRKLFFKYSNLT